MHQHKMSIELIDEDCLPSVCTTGCGNRYCELTRLSNCSLEYIRCRNMIVNEHFVKKFIGVYRVENKFLENEYKSTLITKKNEFPYITERELLHCTANYNVKSIVENNFDPLRATRVKFGRGVSFSPNAAYANLQSSAGSGVRAMFVCKVMIGSTQIGSSNAIPTHPHDTMKDSRGNVYVKYNKFEFYPTHVIFYKSYNVVSFRGQRSIERI